MTHFQLFAEPSPSGLSPTCQVVEVIGNTRSGAATLAALKGDFEVTADGALVREAYTRTEYAGSTQEGAERRAQTVRTTYLGPKLRAVRVVAGDLEEGGGGGVRLYQRMDAAAAQAEIGKLLSTHVQPVDSDGDAPPGMDDGPMWERRAFDRDRGPSWGGGASPDAGAAMM